MNRTEAVTLCRLVRAHCPAQAMDEWTPDAWFDVLAGVRAGDALAAVKHLAKTQAFIAPSEVLARVRYVRNDRLERGRPSLSPPDWIGELEDGPEQVIAHARWLADAERSLADGNPPQQPRALTTMPPDVAAIRAQLTPPAAPDTDTTEESA